MSKVAVKPGRNDPCPCGSGNKYKRCCGLERAGAAAQIFNPNEIGALVLLVEQGRLSEAQQRAQALLGVHPHVGMLWKILSVTLMRQGKDALKALRKTAQLMPNDAEAQSNLGAALHDLGAWDEALTALRTALALRPDDVQTLIDSGNALKALGRAAEAVPFYLEALKLNPRELEAQNNLGNAFLELRQWDKASASYRNALKIKPENAQVTCNLANALRLSGRLEEAIGTSREALVLDPSSTFAENVLGLSLAATGQRQEAAACYRRALSQSPNDFESLTNLGNVLRDLGQMAEAVSVYQRAIDLEPRQATSYCNLGNALLNLQRFDEAIARYRQALALQPNFVLALVSLATGLRLKGQAQQAEVSCQAALSINPNDVDALFLLGELQADRGRFSEAQQLFERVIAINPDFPNAWYAIATHRKMSEEDGKWLDGVQRLLSSKLALRHEIGLRHALGKYYDDLAQYEQAFGHYRQANELTKSYGKIYDRRALEQQVDRIIANFDADFMQKISPTASRSERPVFVIGMPRSGTSLIEQILASHPEVYGAGELTFWDSAFARYDVAEREGRRDADLIPDSAQNYLDELGLLSSDAKRMVDKMPANFMNVGLIHAALPKARFIHVRRHPIDTCLSIYVQHFTFLHPYANELESLAHYYGQYARLMEHWRRVLPAASLLEIPYESLIENQESETRRMLEFIDLPWDARCLDFHQTERVVITLSKWQVRQKLHGRSAGRWRHYERFLGPLRSLVDLTSQRQAL
jgi:tetratricopeptide (TPR) repeat protein